MTGLGEWPGKKIKALRERYDERQEQFCQRLGVSVDALRYWEQDRGEPSGPAKILLGRLEEDLSRKRERQPA